MKDIVAPRSNGSRVFDLQPQKRVAMSPKIVSDPSQNSSAARHLRRKDKEMDDDAAWALFRRAALVHFASTSKSGAPVLRALHPIVSTLFDSPAPTLYFHGSALGERGECVGRRAVVCTEEIVAEVPSYASDPERACPATTFYRSAMVHGVVEEIVDGAEKAAALQMLMERFQPEGGYAPLAVDDKRYAQAIKSISIVAVRPTSIVGKLAMGQMKSPAVREKICNTLWRRGDDGDGAAIDSIVDARPTDAPLPTIVRGKRDTRFLLAPQILSPPQVLLPPQAHYLDQTVSLLRDQYWNTEHDDDTLAKSHLNSLWVLAVRHGDVVATARAISDGAKRATIFDVAVQDRERGYGIGGALVRLLLEHPRMRCVSLVDLGTKDAQQFYRQFGFKQREPMHTRMLLNRNISRKKTSV